MKLLQPFQYPFMGYRPGKMHLNIRGEFIRFLQAFRIIDFIFHFTANCQFDISFKGPAVQQLQNEQQVLFRRNARQVNQFQFSRFLVEFLFDHRIERRKIANDMDLFISRELFADIHGLQFIGGMKFNFCGKAQQVNELQVYFLLQRLKGKRSALQHSPGGKNDAAVHPVP